MKCEWNEKTGELAFSSERLEGILEPIISGDRGDSVSHLLRNFAHKSTGTLVSPDEVSYGPCRAGLLSLFKVLARGSYLTELRVVPPAMETILSSPTNRVQGFLAAGHVCTVMGYAEYEPLARRYGAPIVVTGFEPLDILHGVLMCVQQLEDGRAEVENQYARSVRREGNAPARGMISDVFEVIPRKWRGVGEIADSGLALTEAYRALDAESRFGVADVSVDEPEECVSGLVLQGVLKPDGCAAFGDTCTPESPLGATMVSSEGACAAYYRYRRLASTA